MALRYYHAVRMITDNGLGYPMTYSNSAIGVDTDGKFYLITGRPNIVAGDGKILVGQLHGTWFENILSMDISGMTVNRSIDLIEGGSLGVSSNFSFSVLNTSLFFETLRANGVYLTRCKVKYFYVTEDTSTNTFTFDKRWEGIIDNYPFNEKNFQINCIDNSKLVFKQAPNIPVDTTRFPFSPKDSQGKQVPVAIGYVSNSPMINVSGAGAKQTITIEGGIEKKICAATHYIYSTTYWISMDIKSHGMNFKDNDPRLVGKYITVISGGPAQTRRIWAVNAFGTESGTIFLDHPLVDSSDNYIGPNVVDPAGIIYWTKANTLDNVWYFEISEFAPAQLASENAIRTIKPSSYGGFSLYTFDTDLKKFKDFSETVLSASTTNINNTGFPGISMNEVGADVDGGVQAFFRIRPQAISFRNSVELSPAAPFNYPSYDLPKLYNLDPSDSNYYEYTTIASQSIYGLLLDVKLPEVDLLKTFDKIYLLFDLDIKALNHNVSSFRIDAFVSVNDIYGRQVVVIPRTAAFFDKGVTTTSFREANLLPRKYYNLDPDVLLPYNVGYHTEDDDFYSTYLKLDISGVIDSFKKGLIYDSMFLSIGFNMDNTQQYTIRAKQVGFVGQKSVNLVTDNVYTTLIGETIPTTWADAAEVPRKTIGDPIVKIGDAVEHLIREYDYGYPKWQASHAYLAGDHIDASPDNGSIYVCIVAGTSFTSAPVFPITPDSTVTETGGVKWRHIDFYKINSASFDALALVRGGTSWLVGRTLEDQRKTDDFYKELCQQGYFGMCFDNDGYLRISAWRENITPLLTFDKSLILPGTLGDMQLSDIRRVYNDLLVRYDFNPGSNAYNKQAFVTNVNAPAFPGINEFNIASTIIGSAGIPFSITITKDFSQLFGIFYTFLITCSSPHGLKPGDYVSIQGNTHGYDIPSSVVQNIFTTNQFSVFGHLCATDPSTTGTIYKLSNDSVKWKEYVGGVSDYGTAKHLWNQCHQSYLITKVVQKMPDSLSNCAWFFDPAAVGLGGEQVWEATGDSLTDFGDLGDDHAAINYLQQCAEWLTWQKKQIGFEVIRTTATSTLQLMDPVYFNDAKLTNATNLLGWVTKIADLPSDGKKPDRFSIELTLNPEQLTTCATITDTPGAANTITDTAGATNTITDTPC